MRLEHGPASAKPGSSCRQNTHCAPVQSPWDGARWPFGAFLWPEEALPWHDSRGGSALVPSGLLSSELTMFQYSPSTFFDRIPRRTPQTSPLRDWKRQNTASKILTSWVLFYWFDRLITKWWFVHVENSEKWEIPVLNAISIQCLWYSMFGNVSGLFRFAAVFCRFYSASVMFSLPSLQSRCNASQTFEMNTGRPFALKMDLVFGFMHLRCLNNEIQSFIEYTLQIWILLDPTDYIATLSSFHLRSASGLSNPEICNFNFECITIGIPACTSDLSCCLLSSSSSALPQLTNASSLDTSAAVSSLHKFLK